MGNTCSACKGDQEKNELVSSSQTPQEQLKIQKYDEEDKELDVPQVQEITEVDDEKVIR